MQRLCDGGRATSNPRLWCGNSVLCACLPRHRQAGLLASVAPSNDSASRNGLSARPAMTMGAETVGFERTGRRGLFAPGTAASWTKRSRVTAGRPRCWLIRSISIVARCCSSSATGPAHPRVRVPDAKRRGHVVAAKAGPTISGQSVISAALAGECFTKAAFVTFRKEHPNGAWARMLAPVRCQVLPATRIRLVISETMQTDCP